MGSATGSFVQLFLMRSVVGAGEAGGVPAATSLLADLYPPAKRAGAFSIFYMGTPLGFVISFLVGGWIVTHYGWREVLLLAGLPGIALAVALRFLIKEPARTILPGGADQGPSLPRTFSFIFGKRSLRHLLFTPALTSAGSAGLVGFAASFFVRLHGLNLAQVGLILATFYGAIGSIAGGWFVDRLVVRDPRWPTWWCALAYLTAAPAAALLLLSPSLIGAIIGLTVVSLATNSTYGTNCRGLAIARHRVGRSWRPMR
jgi:MFS family permease